MPYAHRDDVCHVGAVTTGTPAPGPLQVGDELAHRRHRVVDHLFGDVGQLLSRDLTAPQPIAGIPQGRSRYVVTCRWRRGARSSIRPLRARITAESARLDCCTGCLGGGMQIDCYALPQRVALSGREPTRTAATGAPSPWTAVTPSNRADRERAARYGRRWADSGWPSSAWCAGIALVGYLWSRVTFRRRA